MSIPKIYGRVEQSEYRLATGWTIRGSNPGGGEIFCTCPDRPWGPPSLLYNGTASFPGVKSGRDVTLTPHPLLAPWSRKSRTIPLLPLWAYGLYRASVPVQGCTLPFYLLYLKSKSLIICSPLFISPCCACDTPVSV